MKRFSMLGLMLTVVFMSFAATAASASAFELPQILPTLAGEEWSGKATSAEQLFETVGGNKIKCKEGTASGTVEANKTLGPLHISFNKCEGEIKKVKSKCNSLADKAELYLMLGLWHSVVDIDPPGHAAAILFLLESVHINCGLVLLTMSGNVLCLITNPLTLGVTHEFSCTQNKGVQTEKTFLNDAEKLVEDTPGLASTLCGGAAEQMALSMSGSVTFKNEVKIDD